MDAITLLYVIAGAFLHATWNLFAKKASGGLPFVWLFGLVSLAFMVPLSYIIPPSSSLPTAPEAWGTIALSALVHVAYMLTLQQGYRQSDFSVVYPMARGTGPLFSVIGAMVILHEMPSWLGMLGIALIVLGIALLTQSQRLHRDTSEQIHSGVFWGGLTGLCIALYTLVDAWAVKHLNMHPVSYYVLGLGLRSLILAPLALQKLEDLQKQWHINQRWVIYVGLIAPVAYLLILLAMVHAPLSYVAPVRELSMMIGLIFGATLLKESITPRRILGCMLMTLGVLSIMMA